MQIRSILVVTDSKPEQRAALNQASLLAKSNGASLVLASAMEGAPPMIPFVAAASTWPKVEKLLAKEQTKRLQRLAAPLRRAGIRVDIRLLVGTPFLEIIREVLRWQHDLVIMAAEVTGGLKGALFGSTSRYLLRKCPCPVLLVKPERRAYFARLLAAVDPSLGDSTKNALNVKIIEAASSLARLHGSELHVAHAWSLYGESILRGYHSTESKKALAEMLRETRQRLQSSLAELSAPFADDVPYRIHLVKGLPERVIPVLVRKERIDLLVMGTVCRTGIEGFFIGNTAEKVLATVGCSVLTIKPDGFVTPVRLED